MPNKLKFVHLHTHTEFSWLDGLGTIDEYIKRGVELGDPAMAITDHGSLCGVPSFYHAARKNDVEPVLGTEAYFVEDASFRPKKSEGEKNERHHVTLLAKGWDGYQVLSELSTETHRNFYNKPLLDRRMVEDLGNDTKHLVCLSGCASSIISHLVKAGDMRGASREVAWWRDNFPHFYIELQDHGTDFDKQLNAGLLKLARKYHLPWVITNDPHYVPVDDAIYHDRLLAVQMAKDVDDPARMRFDGTGYHLKSRAEMRRSFKSYPDEVWKRGAGNTLKIAKMCYTRVPAWEKRTWHIPKFPDVDDAYIELKRLTMEGLRAKGWERDPVYRSRAIHELKVIKEVGIADFLLITRDAIVWAKEQGIAVGPGRGSVAGTLVGYLVGIHKIDPVRYDLMFERFLNPARPRMPDIDVDFEPERRKELFEYFKERYGKENVVHVAAFQRMKVKAAFKSLAKSYGVSYLDSNRLSKLLPDEIDEDAEGEIGWTEEFKTEIVDRYPELADVLVRIAGTRRGPGSHPAGVIIADPTDNIRKLVPEMWLVASKKMCGQFDLDAVEEMGLLKQDILGLRNLKTIKEAVRIIKETTGEEIDPDAWVPDEEPGDDKVYAMLAEGRTAGVFQFEGATNTGGCRAVKPTCFEDLVSITSLYRTGVISAGFPKLFIKHRAGGRVNYVHPDLEPIFARSWGVILYQEQIMEMARKLAGFTMIEVDDIKESIKHKRSELLMSMEPKFVKGCMEHSGFTKRQADACWNMIKGASGYLYNRAHAVAYTMLSYQTARLKTIYPEAFITALLRTVEKKEKRESYLRDAQSLGIKIRRCHINKSDLHATAEEGAIRFGFVDLAGIGETQGKKILAGRPEGGYTSVAQVAAAVNNVKILGILKDARSMTCFGEMGSRSKMEQLLNWQFSDPMKKHRERWRDDLVTPEEVDAGDNVCLIGVLTKIGPSGKTKKGDPYTTWQIRWDAANAWNIRLWKETSNLWTMKVGSLVKVIGKWESEWANLSVGSPSQIQVIRRVR